MPVRNHLSQKSPKPALTSKQRAPVATPVQSVIATVKSAAKLDALNDLGVVVTPSFTKARPISTTGDIEFRVEAHQFDDGLWGAEFLYVSRADSIPLFGNPLNTEAARFQTLTEAAGDNTAPIGVRGPGRTSRAFLRPERRFLWETKQRCFAFHSCDGVVHPSMATHAGHSQRGLRTAT